MASSPHSDVTTHGIRIRAAAQYLPHESEPEENRYVFAYRITVTNQGDAPARLLSRHWIILDSENRRRDVRGPGVVGEQPRLLPGAEHSYVSHCPMSTTWGTMQGSYTFAYDDGTKFEVEVGRFFLVPSAPPIDLNDAAPEAN